MNGSQLGPELVIAFIQKEIEEKYSAEAIAKRQAEQKKEQKKAQEEQAAIKTTTEYHAKITPQNG